MNPHCTRSRIILAVGAALGAAALGVLWLAVTHEPYVTVVIEDCGKRGYFVERLRRAGVGYSVGQEGKLILQVDDLDELAARLGGPYGQNIPDAAATGRVGGDCK